jgi:hypothetical protein
MIPLSSAISSGLTWSKIPRSRDYKLVQNGEVVGTLERPSIWCAKFFAETQHGRWIFRRGGFVGTGSEILDSATKSPIATFRSSWGTGGILTFADGEAFQIVSRGWWRPVWSVIAANDRPVLEVHTREKTVDVAPGSAIAASRLSLLMMFVWYRVLQAEEDAAGAVVAAIAAS